MQFRISDPNARALVEVDVTLHPEALKAALTDRHGCLGTLLRSAAVTAMTYLALGFQLAIHQFYPELWLQPLTVMLTYLACRAPTPCALAAAFVAGIMLDGYYALPLGANTTAMVVAIGAVTLVNTHPMWPKHNGGLTAILATTTSTLLFALANTLLIGGGLPWQNRFAILPQLLLTTAVLNAAALAPLLFFFLDKLDGNTRPNKETPQEL